MEKISNSQNNIEKSGVEKELIDLVKTYSERIKNFPFFQKLENQPLSLEDYSRYFSQKYSAVGYFTDFLNRGAKIAQDQNLPHLHKAFQSNFNDESGIIDGKYDRDWEHETWRQRMIQNLDVKKINDNTPEYAKMLADLKESQNIFFMAGYLTYIELFVAVEMKKLWEAMKRDLPNDLMEYKKENIPMNPLEYIKNHADHDGNHYKEILDAIVADFRNEQDSKDCKQGIQFAFQVREKLYENLNKVTFEDNS